MTIRVTTYNRLWRIATLALLFSVSFSALSDNKVTKHKVEKQFFNSEVDPDPNSSFFTLADRMFLE